MKIEFSKVVGALCLVLFFGVVSVFAGNVLVSESGISAAYSSSNGNTGATFNLSVVGSDEKDYLLVVENGIIVSQLEQNYTGPAGNLTYTPLSGFSNAKGLNVTNNVSQMDITHDTSFATGASDGTTGIFIAGDYIYTTDYASDLIRKFTKTGTPVSSCGTGGSAIMGMDSDGTTVWGVDYNSLTAKKWANLACGSRTTWSLNANNDMPSGVYYYDGVLYIVDSVDKMIYKYNSGTLAFIETLDISNVDFTWGTDSPWGITGDGDVLYVGIRGSSRRIVSYDYNGNYLGQIANISTEVNDVLGLDMDNDKFYVHSSDGQSVYIYDYTNEVLALTNYSVEITVPFESGMQGDFDDLRFSMVNGTKVPYYVSNISGSQANVFVKVNLGIGSNLFVMSYGNSSVVSESVLSASQGITTPAVSWEII